MGPTTRSGRSRQENKEDQPRSRANTVGDLQPQNKKRKRRSKSASESQLSTENSSKKENARPRSNTLGSTSPEALQKVKRLRSGSKVKRPSTVSNVSIESADLGGLDDVFSDMDTSSTNLDISNNARASRTGKSRNSSAVNYVDEADLGDEFGEDKIEELSDEGYASAKENLELTEDKYVKILNIIIEELKEELSKEVDEVKCNEINEKILDVQGSIDDLERNGNFRGNWINLLERRVDFTISIRDWMEKKREEGVDILPYVPELMMRVVTEICKTVNKNYDPTKDEESGKDLKSVWQAKRLIHYFKDLNTVMTVEQCQTMTRLIIRTNSKSLVEEVCKESALRKIQIQFSYPWDKKITGFNAYEILEYSIKSEKVASAKAIVLNLFSCSHIMYNGRHLLSNSSAQSQRNLTATVQCKTSDQAIAIVKKIHLSAVSTKGFSDVVLLMLAGDVLHFLRIKGDSKNVTNNRGKYREYLDSIIGIAQLNLSAIIQSVTYIPSKKIKRKQDKANFTVQTVVTPYLIGRFIAELFFNHKSDADEFIDGSYKDKEEPTYSSLNYRYRDQEDLLSSLSASSHLHPNPVFKVLYKSIISKKNNLDVVTGLLSCICKDSMQELLQENKNTVGDEKIAKVLKLFGVEKKCMNIVDDDGNSEKVPSNKSTIIQGEFKNEIGSLLVTGRADYLSKENFSRLKRKLQNDEVLTLPDEKLDIAFSELSREIIEEDYVDGQGLSQDIIDKMKRRIDFIVETCDTKLQNKAIDDFHRTFMNSSINSKMTVEQRQEITEYIINKECLVLLKKCSSEYIDDNGNEKKDDAYLGCYSAPHFQKFTGKYYEQWALYAIQQKKEKVAPHLAELLYYYRLPVTFAYINLVSGKHTLSLRSAINDNLIKETDIITKSVIEFAKDCPKYQDFIKNKQSAITFLNGRKSIKDNKALHASYKEILNRLSLKEAIEKNLLTVEIRKKIFIMPLLEEGIKNNLKDVVLKSMLSGITFFYVFYYERAMEEEKSLLDCEALPAFQNVVDVVCKSMAKLLCSLDTQRQEIIDSNIKGLPVQLILIVGMIWELFVNHSDLIEKISIKKEDITFSGKQARKNSKIRIIEDLKESFNKIKSDDQYVSNLHQVIDSKLKSCNGYSYFILGNRTFFAEELFKEVVTDPEAMDALRAVWVHILGPLKGLIDDVEREHGNNETIEFLRRLLAPPFVHRTLFYKGDYQYKLTSSDIRDIAKSSYAWEDEDDVFFTCIESVGSLKTKLQDYQKGRKENSNLVFTLILYEKEYCIALVITYNNSKGKYEYCYYDPLNKLPEEELKKIKHLVSSTLVRCTEIKKAEVIQKEKQYHDNDCEILVLENAKKLTDLAKKEKEFCDQAISSCLWEPSPGDIKEKRENFAKELYPVAEKSMLKNQDLSVMEVSDDESCTGEEMPTGSASTHGPASQLFLKDHEVANRIEKFDHRLSGDDIVHIAKRFYRWEEPLNGKFLGDADKRVFFTSHNISELEGKLERYKDDQQKNSDLIFSSIIQVNNNHWVTLVVKHRENEFEAYYCNSCGESVPSGISQALSGILKVKKDGIKSSEVEQQQDDDIVNCGIFVLENVKSITDAMKDNKSFDEIDQGLWKKPSPEELEEKRKKFAKELREKQGKPLPSIAKVKNDSVYYIPTPPRGGRRHSTPIDGSTTPTQQNINKHNREGVMPNFNSLLEKQKNEYEEVINTFLDNVQDIKNGFKKQHNEVLKFYFHRRYVEETLTFLKDKFISKKLLNSFSGNGSQSLNETMYAVSRKKGFALWDDFATKIDNYLKGHSTSDVAEGINIVTTNKILQGYYEACEYMLFVHTLLIVTSIMQENDESKRSSLYNKLEQNVPILLKQKKSLKAPIDLLLGIISYYDMVSTPLSPTFEYFSNAAKSDHGNTYGESILNRALKTLPQENINEVKRKICDFSNSMIGIEKSKDSNDKTELEEAKGYFEKVEKSSLGKYLRAMHLANIQGKDNQACSIELFKKILAQQEENDIDNEVDLIRFSYYAVINNNLFRDHFSGVNIKEGKNLFIDLKDFAEEESTASYSILPRLGDYILKSARCIVARQYYKESANFTEQDRPKAREILKIGLCQKELDHLEGLDKDQGSRPRKTSTPSTGEGSFLGNSSIISGEKNRTRLTENHSLPLKRILSQDGSFDSKTSTSSVEDDSYRGNIPSMSSDIGEVSNDEVFTYSSKRNPNKTASTRKKSSSASLSKGQRTIDDYLSMNNNKSHKTATSLPSQDFISETEKGNYQFWFECGELHNIAERQYKYLFETKSVIFGAEPIAIPGSKGETKCVDSCAPEEIEKYVKDYIEHSYYFGQYRQRIEGTEEPNRPILTLIINLGDHITTLVIARSNENKDRIYYCNSLGGGLYNKVDEELLKRLKSELNLEEKDMMISGAKQQKDTYNCGIYALENACRITKMMKEGKSFDEIEKELEYTFTPKELEEKRKKFAEALKSTSTSANASNSESMRNDSTSSNCHLSRMFSESGSKVVVNDKSATGFDNFSLVEVPAGSNSLFWSVALAYLYNVRHDNDAFRKRFKNLFGGDEGSEHIEKVQGFMKEKDISKILSDEYKSSEVVEILTPLVTQKFRQMVVNKMSRSMDSIKGKYFSIKRLLSTKSASYFKGEFYAAINRNFGEDIDNSSGRYRVDKGAFAFSIEDEKMLKNAKVQFTNLQMSLICLKPIDGQEAIKDSQSISQALEAIQKLSDDISEEHSQQGKWENVKLTDEIRNSYEAVLRLSSKALQMSKKQIDLEQKTAIRSLRSFCTLVKKKSLDLLRSESSSGKYKKVYDEIQIDYIIKSELELELELELKLKTKTKTNKLVEIHEFLVDEYLKCMRYPDAWGSEYEIEAIKKMLNIDIKVEKSSNQIVQFSSDSSKILLNFNEEIGSYQFYLGKKDIALSSQDIVQGAENNIADDVLEVTILDQYCGDLVSRSLECIKDFDIALENTKIYLIARRELIRLQEWHLSKVSDLFSCKSLKELNDAVVRYNNDLTDLRNNAKNLKVFNYRMIENQYSTWIQEFDALRDDAKKLQGFGVNYRMIENQYSTWIQEFDAFHSYLDQPNEMTNDDKRSNLISVLTHYCSVRYIKLYSEGIAYLSLLLECMGKSKNREEYDYYTRKARAFFETLTHKGCRQTYSMAVKDEYFSKLKKVSNRFQVLCKSYNDQEDDDKASHFKEITSYLGRQFGISVSGWLYDAKDELLKKVENVGMQGMFDDALCKDGSFNIGNKKFSDTALRESNIEHTRLNGVSESELVLKELSEKIKENSMSKSSANIDMLSPPHTPNPDVEGMDTSSPSGTDTQKGNIPHPEYQTIPEKDNTPSNSNIRKSEKFLNVPKRVREESKSPENQPILKNLKEINAGKKPLQPIAKESESSNSSSAQGGLLYNETPTSRPTKKVVRSFNSSTSSASVNTGGAQGQPVRFANENSRAGYFSTSSELGESSLSSVSKKEATGSQKQDQPKPNTFVRKPISGSLKNQKFFSEKMEVFNARYKVSLKIGAAKRQGDSFFDAVAQGLNELNDSKEFSVQSLRSDCADHAKQNAKKGNTLYSKIIENSERGGYIVEAARARGVNIINQKETLKKYLETIKDVPIQDGDSIPGRPDIEGKMICDEYKVKLQVVYYDKDNKELCIDNVGRKTNGVIYILRNGEHFVPLSEDFEKNIFQNMKASRKEIYGEDISNDSLEEDISNDSLEEDISNDSLEEDISNDSLESDRSTSSRDTSPDTDVEGVEVESHAKSKKAQGR